MNLWAVTMVRDEMDVLPYTLQHLVSEGVDGIIVADNLSIDGTWEWLQELRLDCELVVRRDSEIGYYQSRKMTALAHDAMARGADWVIPFDADEFWYNGVAPRSIRATLAAAPPVQCLQAPLHNYFPTSADPAAEPNPFLRITHRDPAAAPLPKVVVRRGRDLTIAQGNHGAIGPPPFNCGPTALWVGHFPWRTPEQFERKIRNGYQAYMATDLPEHVGAHWRQYGETLISRGPAAVHDIFNTWFFDPKKRLTESPVPWGRANARSGAMRR